MSEFELTEKSRQVCGWTGWRAALFLTPQLERRFVRNTQRVIRSWSPAGDSLVWECGKVRGRYWPLVTKEATIKRQGRGVRHAHQFFDHLSSFSTFHLCIFVVNLNRVLFQFIWGKRASFVRREICCLHPFESGWESPNVEFWRHY